MNIPIDDAGETIRRIEREAIARMLCTEAEIHEAAADECDHEEDGDEEATQHRWDAETLRRMANHVRARSNPSVVEMGRQSRPLEEDFSDEPAF